MVTRSKSHHPTCFLTSTDLSSSDLVEPQSYQEAAQLAAWTIAMVDEYIALMQQGTWSLFLLPKRLLVANGFFVSKKIQMVQLFDTKPDWLPKDFSKLKAYGLSNSPKLEGA
ncbi:uncharacterized protein LOC114281499 isoform X2 [Camellia sinensis]|uniref:uncharacterized protein LOC114281499 isoform X2 n=1 Tax=Camellia sinensis TaxID=4442 RepID=UPI001036A0BE|nr:uncharacterized protein LOC114281499 isoform X2 [Camellia sinensis]